MSLIKVKHAVRALPLSQLRKLDLWLHELIRRTEETEYLEESPPRKQTVSEQVIDNKTYRLESIRCGKEKCKCTRGKLHGPYWYSYTRAKGKVISRYIGKKLPNDIQN